jgi:hypothetical protein
VNRITYKIGNRQVISADGIGVYYNENVRYTYLEFRRYSFS